MSGKGSGQGHDSRSSCQLHPGSLGLSFPGTVIISVLISFSLPFTTPYSPRYLGSLGVIKDDRREGKDDECDEE